MKDKMYESSFNNFNESIQSNQPIDNVIERSNYHKIHKENKVK